jgi:damage-control phosphatase, subfamily I
MSRIMKVTENCYGCLKRLVEQTIALSRGDRSALFASINLLDGLWKKGGTPPLIANSLLRHIKEITGVSDPFGPSKKMEFDRAIDAAKRLDSFFPSTLEGVLKFSALGNSMDHFLQDSFDPLSFLFSAPMDIIRGTIYNNREEAVLILGDNMGDFLFDLKLIGFLKGLGKHVYYAVREHPVQNDLSMKDVAAFDLTGFYDNIISTGTDEVGIQRAHLWGTMKALWEGGAVVIAKGMGNYETISEFNRERPVIHILKVKCVPVGETLDHPIGSYIAIIGGEGNGNKKRLL